MRIKIHLYRWTGIYLLKKEEGEILSSLKDDYGKLIQNDEDFLISMWKVRNSIYTRYEEEVRSRDFAAKERSVTEKIIFYTTRTVKCIKHNLFIVLYDILRR